MAPCGAAASWPGLMLAPRCCLAAPAFPQGTTSCLLSITAQQELNKPRRQQARPHHPPAPTPMVSLLRWLPIPWPAEPAELGTAQDVKNGDFSKTNTWIFSFMCSQTYVYIHPVEMMCSYVHLHTHLIANLWVHSIWHSHKYKYLEGNETQHDSTQRIYTYFFWLVNISASVAWLLYPAQQELLSLHLHVSTKYRVLPSGYL